MGGVARVLLLLPSGTYRAGDFLAAAARLGVEVVVGSQERQTLAASMGNRALVVPLVDVAAATDAIAELHARARLDAVVAVDDLGVIVAAHAAARLGLAHNQPDAVAATRDKAVMRARFARAGVPQPEFRVVAAVADVAAAASEVGLPCVIKPVSLSASRGVIRANDLGAVAAAAARIRAMVDGPLLVERYLPGDEVAVEEPVAYLRLSGGCQGCWMATVTLGQGIDVALLAAVPEISQVIDVTDHASGTNPYFESAKQ